MSHSPVAASVSMWSLFRSPQQNRATGLPSTGAAAASNSSTCFICHGRLSGMSKALTCATVRCVLATATLLPDALWTIVAMVTTRSHDEGWSGVAAWWTSSNTPSRRASASPSTLWPVRWAVKSAYPGSFSRYSSVKPSVPGQKSYSCRQMTSGRRLARASQAAAWRSRHGSRPSGSQMRALGARTLSWTMRNRARAMWPLAGGTLYWR
mmetsp:Transcript_39217/g.110865  ORF Transcript_39217/g.110865 Transcript_39217/m.110865 type:complete len:209 (-) Transcript_39217:21-647(-)